MSAIRILVPDAGPLITLAKLGALDALLIFKPSVRIVVTDYVDYEATRRREELPDAQAIHEFIRNNAGRVEIQETGYGKNFLQVVRFQEQFVGNPELAAQFKVDMTPPADPGEKTIIEFVRDLIDEPPGTPALILAEDDSLLRELAPLPGNAHMLSTRAFLDALPQLAKLADKPKLWALVGRFRQDHESAATVDRGAAKIPTTWQNAVVPENAAAIVRAVRKRPPAKA